METAGQRSDRIWTKGGLKDGDSGKSRINSVHASQCGQGREAMSISMNSDTGRGCSQ